MSGMQSAKGVEERRSYTPSAMMRGDCDWDAIAADLSPILCERDPAIVRRRSRDFFWYSPVLKQRLDGKAAGLVVVPATEEELLTLARYCVANGLPLTPRGAGTGNYGQCVPLHGGIVLDMTALGGIRWVQDGVLRAGAGARMRAVEAELLAQGWEFRMHPSTHALSTLGGFVGGGSTGVGAINFGTNNEPGNIAGLRILTLEDEPRFIELRGKDLRKGVHAYGTTGLITEVEMPLAPATAWREAAICCPTTMDAVRLGDALARADGLIKKLVAPLAWSAARHLGPLASVMKPGEAVLIVMVAERSWEGFATILADHRAEIVLERAYDPKGKSPLYELTWNHTTLHAIKADPSITYLQTLFPAPDYLAKIEKMDALLGDEVPMHIEFVRLGGTVQCFGLQLLHYTSEARLREIIAVHEAEGCPIYDPHTYLLENGGKDTADPVQFEFKRQSDPRGLLNPGKMPGFGVALSPDAVLAAPSSPRL